MGQGVEWTVGGRSEGGEGVQDDPGISPSPLGLGHSAVLNQWLNRVNRN